MPVKKIKVKPRVKPTQETPQPVAKAPIKRRIPLEEQFRTKYVITDIFPKLVTGVISDKPCWKWVGANNGKGPEKSYGIFGRPKRYAHRYAYERFRGPIPKGMVIDHLCRHRWCVNPDHLDCVTTANNLKRGAHPNFVSHRTGMCVKGLHDLNNSDNVYLRADGRAFCKPCYEAARERRLERQAKIGKPGEFRFVNTQKETPKKRNAWGMEE